MNNKTNKNYKSIKPKNLIRFLLLSLLLIIACQNPVNSEEVITLNTPISTAKKVNIEEAVQVALNNNRQILSKNQNIKIYKLAAQRSFTNILPDVGCKLQYKYNTMSQDASVSIPGLSPIIFRMGQKSDTTVALGTSYDVGSVLSNIYQYKVDNQNYRSAFYDSDSTKELTVNSVYSYFFDILKQRQLIDYYKQNIMSLQSYYDVAMNNFKQGNALKTDYMKILIEIKNAEHELLVQQNTLKTQMNNFKYLLGIDISTSIDLLDQFKDDKLVELSNDELFPIAINNRKDLKIAESNIKLARFKRKMALSGIIPQIDVYTAAYSQDGSGMDNLVFGVNGSVSIWQWINTPIEVKEKTALIKQQQIELEDLIEQVKIDIITQKQTISESVNSIDVSNETVELAKETLRITKLRYDNGLALVSDLLDDQNNLLSADVDLLSAKYDYQKDIVELKKKLGTLYIAQ